MTIALLGWNVLFKSSPADIIKHIKHIEKTEGVIAIACLQEIPIVSLEHPETEIQKIAHALGMQYHFDLSAQYRKNIYFGIAILSKFPFIKGSQKSFDLRKSNNANDIARKLITADLEIPGRKNLRVGNFHLSPIARPPRRMTEVKTLTTHLENCDIAFGDANAPPRSPYAKRIFATVPRVDDRTSEPTFYRHIGPFKLIKMRLDYALGKIETEEAKILNQGPSDHRPLFVKIKT